VDTIARAVLLTYGSMSPKSHFVFQGVGQEHRAPGSGTTQVNRSPWAP